MKLHIILMKPFYIQLANQEIKNLLNILIRYKLILERNQFFYMIINQVTKAKKFYTVLNYFFFMEFKN